MRRAMLTARRGHSPVTEMRASSIAFAVLSCFALPAIAAAPPALSARLRALAGDAAQDCGAVGAADERAAALDCANRALSAGAPFRVALQLADGASWQAAARDPQGRLWAVFYEVDAQGGAGPTLSALLCRTLTLSTHGDDALDCAPTLDAH